MDKTDIAQLGNPVLRKIAEQVKDITGQACQTLISDMMKTVAEAGGVGIAAPQIHHSKRIFVMCSKPNLRYPDAPVMEPTAIINPEIVSASAETIIDWEGCLSVPSIRGKVARHKTIKVRYFDHSGTEVIKEFSGFVARIFQHELDHLNGLTFVDQVDSNSDLISESEWYKQYT